MTEYAMAGNIWSAPVLRDYVAWPSDTSEGEALASMDPGDLLIPKFAGEPITDKENKYPLFESFANDVGIDADQAISEYEATMNWGQSAMPYILRIIGHLDDFTANGKKWSRAKVEQRPVEYPLETKEFLRLRALPDDIATQFKGMVSRGRHFQPVPPGTAERVLQATKTADRGDHLRQFSLVEAESPKDALTILQSAGRSQLPGDLVLAVNAQEILGIFGFDEATGAFEYEEGMSNRSPIEVRAIFEEAILRNDKYFSKRMARQAIRDIIELLDSESDLFPKDDFRGFYDPFRLLNRRINTALEIRQRPLPVGMSNDELLPSEDAPEGSDESEAEVVIEAEELDGLDIENVRNELPHDFVLPDHVLAEAVTALRSGKHLLLSGPPGTGKSTLAEALCRAVVKTGFRVATATADWTTFDTIGGYMPSEDGKLHFEPGIVMRCLRAGGQWLIIDEINRADIDKAFGPLFTLLASTGGSHQAIELPFQQDKKSIHIERAESVDEASGEYVVTPHWRLIGTLNSSDKASLFQLSFAFLRRFAVVEVPLPEREDYLKWFAGSLDGVEEKLRAEIAAAATNLAFVKERELGPAILGDIRRFINKALTETSSGGSTFDAISAFISAIRLFAVAQYEGARPDRIEEAENAILGVWPNPPELQWNLLREALKEVSLA